MFCILTHPSERVFGTANSTSQSIVDGLFNADIAPMFVLISVAVVIPFRDREPHLVIFLNHLIPMLIRQQIEFTIYVVDQVSVSFVGWIAFNVWFVPVLWCCP